VRSSRGTYAAKPSPKPEEARRAETVVNLADFFLPGPRLHLLDFWTFELDHSTRPRSRTLTHANMAGPSDKARFFLEQSATELNELERKKIFTRVCLSGAAAYAQLKQG
jgi:hypothetical protein